MPRVIISTGHSSSNPGTIANGLREVDVIRQIAKATLPHLRANGIISLSVPPDLDVSQRIEWINKSGYAEENNDVCIELHLNSGGDSGLEGWYEDEGQNKSEALAEDILQKTAEETGLKNNGAHSEYDHEYGSLAFLHETLPVAALIECGFIDNNDDAEFLKKPENIEKVGRGIAKGILKYFGIEFKDSLSAGSNTIPTPPSPASVTPTPAPITNISDNGSVTPAPRPTTTYTPPSTISNTDPFANRPLSSPAGGGMKPMMTRDERKDMITKHYIKILGREPNQNDLNYFLNIGITEDQLIKKMIDSQEHADLVKARQEILKTKKKFNDQQTELIRLRNQTADQQRILDNMQQSINEKNLSLAEMQQKITEYQKINSDKTIVKQHDGVNPNYKGTFLDRLFRAFSDLFE